MESLILRDFEERQALASRLSKWARPPFSDAYISQSRSIGKFKKQIFFCKYFIFKFLGGKFRALPSSSFAGVLVFQQLEIDYVIGELGSSSQAAIIRIFGVTGEGIYSRIF